MPRAMLEFFDFIAAQDLMDLPLEDSRERADKMAEVGRLFSSKKVSWRDISLE